MIRFLFLIGISSTLAQAHVMSSLPKSTPVQKQVSLTFDDGPSLRTTPRVLDILKKYKIPATFFVLGQRAQAHPQLIRRLIKEGHVVANHSYSHPQMTKLDSHAQIREIQKTHDAIAPLSTEPIKWFRPPYGSYNKKIEQLVAQKGMTVVLWNVDPQDWQRKKSSTDICHSVVDQVRPGSIILLHDIHERTVNALEKMIQSLLNKGYTFVPLRASK